VRRDFPVTWLTKWSRPESFPTPHLCITTDTLAGVIYGLRPHGAPDRFEQASSYACRPRRVIPDGPCVDVRKETNFVRPGGYSAGSGGHAAILSRLEIAGGHSKKPCSAVTKAAFRRLRIWKDRFSSPTGARSRSMPKETKTSNRLPAGTVSAAHVSAVPGLPQRIVSHGI